HLTAMLEGLERYCGMEPRGKKTNITGSYNELKSEALNPNLLGLHASTQYELKNFPFEKFDPDRKINWVWGYSITKK
ncbi:YcaO-like family protein, partial [Escherichia coli]|nr:YcaO-like family protein [Escherichia coli]